MNTTPNDQATRISDKETRRITTKQTKSQTDVSIPPVMNLDSMVVPASCNQMQYNMLIQNNHGIDERNEYCVQPCYQSENRRSQTKFMTIYDCII
jgi:hypothetical protein